MKILYAAAEAYPFIKTGGLADVAGSLPLSLNNMGQDVRVVLPLYSRIDRKYTEEMELIAQFYVDLDWRHQYAGVYEYKLDNTIFYFIDNKQYFDRSELYGELDDGERFIFFSKAVTMLPKMINFKPDIIHSNDWHCAMVNVLAKDFAIGDPYYRDIKLLFTIHNLKYQGLFPPDLLQLTGLNPYYFSEDALKFYDVISFMKGGIIYSDAFNTVSGSYALEIKNGFFGETLDGVIRKYDYKLSGIVNGIDYEVWNPETDAFLPHHYSKDDLEGKRQNKLALQKLYGLPERDDVPIISMVTRLVEMKGMDLVNHALEELLQKDIQFVVLGTGTAMYEDSLRYFEWKFPDKMRARIYYNNDESHLIYAGSDYFLMPSLSEPCGVSQLIAMRYGTIPIVREAGGLKDTVQPYLEDTGKGNGFSFTNINAHDMMYTIDRALSFYDDPEHFQQIVENAMTSEHNWDDSSKAYIQLYEKM
ncbi:MAG: glycogen synthase GlgA [Tissierellia bacterium]|nr:glycogen synthase GlgA [Tissierellia bacterium]